MIHSVAYLLLAILLLTIVSWLYNFLLNHIMLQSWFLFALLKVHLFLDWVSFKFFFLVESIVHQSAFVNWIESGSLTFVVTLWFDKKSSYMLRTEKKSQWRENMTCEKKKQNAYHEPEEKKKFTWIWKSLFVLAKYKLSPQFTPCLLLFSISICLCFWFNLFWVFVWFSFCSSCSRYIP